MASESGEEWLNIGKVVQTLLDTKNGPRYLVYIIRARYGKGKFFPERYSVYVCQHMS